MTDETKNPPGKQEQKKNKEQKSKPVAGPGSGNDKTPRINGRMLFRPLLAIVAIVAITAAVLVINDRNEPAPRIIAAGDPALKQSVKSNKANIERLQRRVKQLQNKIKHIDGQILNTAKPSSRNKFDGTMAGQLAQLELQINNLKSGQTAVQSMQQQYARMQQAIDELQNKIEPLQKQQSEMQKQIADQDRRFSSTKTQQETDIQTTPTTTLTVDNSNLQKTFIKQSEQISSLNNQVREFSEKLQQQQTTLKELNDTQRQQRELRDKITTLQAQIKTLQEQQNVKAQTVSQLFQTLAVVQVIRDRISHGKEFDDVMPFLLENLKRIDMPMRKQIEKIAAMRNKSSKTNLIVAISSIYDETIGKYKKDKKDRSFFEFDKAASKRCQKAVKFMRDSTVGGNITAALGKLEDNSKCRTRRLDNWYSNATIYEDAEIALSSIEDNLILAIAKANLARGG